MKRNKFAILSALLLGVVAFWFYKNNGKGTINDSLRSFSVEDPNTINKIVLTKNTTVILLERETPSEWMLNGEYEINSNALKSLLYSINNIEVKEPIAKSLQEDIRKDLFENGIKCEVFQNNKLAKAYYIGKQTSGNSGTNMVLMDMETMLPAEKAFVVYIPGVENNLAPNYTAEERFWRNQTVFHYNPTDIKSVKIEIPESPEAGYELILNGGGDCEVKMLTTNKQVSAVDTLAVKQYLSYFEQLNFESFKTDFSTIQFDSVVKSSPLNILTVTDNTGRVNKVKFYLLKNTNNSLDKDGKPLEYDPERLLALLNNGKDLVVVKYYEFGKVLPAVSYFQRK